jgi:hypothetical protein
MNETKETIRAMVAEALVDGGALTPPELATEPGIRLRPVELCL